MTYAGMSAVESAQLLVIAAVQGAREALAEMQEHDSDADLDAYVRLWVIGEVVNGPPSQGGTP